MLASSGLKKAYFKVVGVVRTIGQKASLAMLLIGASLTVGCQVGMEDLTKWERITNGKGRLAAYLADHERPLNLRVHAAGVLLRMRALTEIMGVISKAYVQDRSKLVQALGHMVTEYVTKDKYDEEQKMVAVGLAYYLFEYADDLRGQNYDTPRDKKLVESVVDWSLERLKLYKTTPKGPRTLQQVVTAAVIARPKIALPLIYNFLRRPPDVERFLLVNQTLTALRNPKVHAVQATYLLEQAKRQYPAVGPELAMALLENRNETLLRFLLDTARDYRVPIETRELGLKAARVMKKTALPGLYRILRTEDPKQDNIPRLNALDLVWDIGGTETLAASLQSLPPAGTYWPKGVEFKAQVMEFCEAKLKPAKENVKPILEGLVDDPNWVTRVYAMECIIQLYDDSSELLEPLLADEQVLLGWDEHGETTIGEYVKAATEKTN
jgi:hypothetical protein